MQKTLYAIVNTHTEEIVATSEDLELIRHTITLIELDNPGDDFDIEQISVNIRVP